jgi:hypothetical protein
MHAMENEYFLAENPENEDCERFLNMSYFEENNEPSTIISKQTSESTDFQQDFCLLEKEYPSLRPRTSKARPVVYTWPMCVEIPGPFMYTQQQRMVPFVAHSHYSNSEFWKQNMAFFLAPRMGTASPPVPAPFVTQIPVSVRQPFSYPSIPQSLATVTSKGNTAAPQAPVASSQKPPAKVTRKQAAAAAQEQSQKRQKTAETVESPESTSLITTPDASPEPIRRTHKKRHILDRAGAVQCEGINRKLGTRCRNAALKDLDAGESRYCAEHIDLNPHSLHQKCASLYQKEPGDAKPCKEIVLKEVLFCYKHFEHFVLKDLLEQGNFDGLQRFNALITPLVQQLEEHVEAAKTSDMDRYQRKKKLLNKYLSIRDQIHRAMALLRQEPLWVPELVPSNLPSGAYAEPLANISATSSPYSMSSTTPDSWTHCSDTCTPEDSVLLLPNPADYLSNEPCSPLLVGDAAC